MIKSPNEPECLSVLKDIARELHNQTIISAEMICLANNRHSYLDYASFARKLIDSEFEEKKNA